MPVTISRAVEGLVDGALFERLVLNVGGIPGTLHVTDGRPRLLARLKGFNAAARFTPWLVLVDLDRGECAPPFRRGHLPRPAAKMSFRDAVRAIEAWLLADRAHVADWLMVPLSAIPKNPELLPDPKRALVDLCRRSRALEIREEMVPREGSGRSVGALYTSRLIEFIGDARNGWRPKVAARTSDSLARCLRDLRRLASG